MEDTHVLRSDEVSALGAVFDGHGGKKVADYCAAKFFDFFDEAVGLSEDRMYETLVRLDATLDKKTTHGGVCAVAFALVSGGVTVGNVGDAEAFWVPDEPARNLAGGAVRLTELHRLSNATELMRIYNAGARIEHPYYTDPMTLNGLMPTRSIGDFSFSRVGRISTPSVKHKVLIGAGWLVVACDGLWDEVTREDLPGLLAGRTNAGEAAAFLRDEAIDRRKGTDNVSVIVVRVI
jgi:serine/threonine protein phosphatase PrpC